MNTPHKHAALIKAWADGAQIQILVDGRWQDCTRDGIAPSWYPAYIYRIKPKPMIKKYRYVVSCGEHDLGAEVTTRYYESSSEVPGRHAVRLDWTMIEVEDDS